MKKAISRPTTSFIIDAVDLERLLSGMGDIFAADIAHDIPYNILDAIYYVALTEELTVQQKCYLTFWLGQLFGDDPEKLEATIMNAFIKVHEKLGDL